MLTRERLIEIFKDQCRAHRLDPEREDIRGAFNNLLTVVLCESDWDREELEALRTFHLALVRERSGNTVRHLFETLKIFYNRRAAAVRKAEAES